MLGFDFESRMYKISVTEKRIKTEKRERAFNRRKTTPKKNSLLLPFSVSCFPSRLCFQQLGSWRILSM